MAIPHHYMIRCCCCVCWQSLVERKAVLGEQDLFKNAYALIAVRTLLYLVCVLHTMYM